MARRDLALIPNEPDFRYPNSAQCTAHAKVCKECGLRRAWTNPETGEHFPGCTCETFIPRRCKQPVRPGFAVCRFHGAGEIDGPAGGRPIETGRYSFLREELSGLMEDYYRGLEDPMLMSVRSEMAMLSARGRQLVEMQATQGVSSLSEAWGQLKDGIEAIERGAVESGLRLVYEAINGLDRDKEIWDEFRTNSESFRKLAETERKRESELGQVITIARLMVLMTELVDRFNRLMIEHVKDEQLRNTLTSAYAAEIRGIISSRISEATRRTS